jgi:hypothetical protein
MCRAPPKVSLRTVSFDADTLEDFARTHVEKLHISFGMLLLVASDKLAQHVLAVRSVNEQPFRVAVSLAAR